MLATFSSLSSRLPKGCYVKKFNIENLLCYYSPLYGVTSYGLLAVKVMNPGTPFWNLPNRDVTNILLCSSIYGSSLYIYNRKHLQNVPVTNRILYSIYGGLLYCFGSVLIWAVLRSLLPDNKILTFTVGLVTAGIFTNTGCSYLNFIDAQLADKK